MNVTAATYNDEVLTSDQAVVVDYYADWCAPCRAVAPVLAQLAEKHQLKLVKVNVDEEQDLARNAGVMGIPHIQLMRNGEVQGEATGALPLDRLEERLGLGN